MLHRRPLGHAAARTLKIRARNNVCSFPLTALAMLLQCLHASSSANLAGHVFTATDAANSTYVVTMGTGVVQGNRNCGTLTSVTSSFNSITGTTSVSETYTDGDSTGCGGLHRSSAISVSCGSSYSMSVTQPSLCYYTFTATAPECCPQFTPSPTVTSSVTASGTPSALPTRNATRKPSSSATATVTHATPSRTPTRTPSPHITRNTTTAATPSPTFSPHNTPNASTAATHTPMPTRASPAGTSFCVEPSFAMHTYTQGTCRPLESIFSAASAPIVSCVRSQATSHLSAGLPLGTVAGDVCVVSCENKTAGANTGGLGSSTGNGLLWGSPALMCDGDGNWTVPYLPPPATWAAPEWDATAWPWRVDCNETLRLRGIVEGAQCIPYTAPAPVIDGVIKCNDTVRVYWTQPARASAFGSVTISANSSMWSNSNASSINETFAAWSAWDDTETGQAQLAALQQVDRVPTSYSLRVCVSGSGVCSPVFSFPGGAGPFGGAQPESQSTSLLLLDTARSLIDSSNGSLIVTTSLAEDESLVAVFSGVQGNATRTLLMTVTAVVNGMSCNASSTTQELSKDHEYTSMSPAQAVTCATLTLVGTSVFGYTPSTHPTQLIVSDSLPAAGFLVAVQVPGALWPAAVDVTCAVLSAASPATQWCSENVAIDTPTRTLSLQLLASTSLFHVAPRMPAFAFSSSTVTSTASVQQCYIQCSLTATTGSVSFLQVAPFATNDTGALDLPAPARIALTYYPTLWPLFSDAILELPDGSCKSAWAPPVLTPDTPQDSSAAAIDTSLLGVVGDVMPPERGIFSHTVSGRYNMTLVANLSLWKEQRAGFSSETRVFVGGVRARVWHVSLDGRMVRFETPEYLEVCGAGMTQGTDCGFKTLAVSSAPTNWSALFTAAYASMYESASATTVPATANLLGATLACPPFCPGLGSRHTVVPAVASVSSGGAAMSPIDSKFDITMQTASLSTTTLLTGGVYYMVGCVGYPSPASGVCGNASHPLARACAWGSGDSCTPCSTFPEGTVCPGGARLWPGPGYFVPSQALPVVTRCLEPASRCRGWDATTDAVLCQEGYMPGSPGCSVCAAGYYPSMSGECSLCPAGTSLWQILQTVLVLLATLAGLALLSYVIVLFAIHHAGGDKAEGVRLVTQFVGVVVFAMQSLAQVSKAAAPGLPESLQRFYQFYSIFQFEFPTVPPACAGEGRIFQLAVTHMAAAGVLLTLYLALNLDAWWCCCVRSRLVQTYRSGLNTAAASTLQRLVPLLLGMLFALVCNTCLGLMTCREEEMSIRWYLQHAVEGLALPPAYRQQLLAFKRGVCEDTMVECATVQRMTQGMVTVRTLRQYPSVVCGEGTADAFVAGAVCILFLYILVFGVFSAYLVAFRVTETIHARQVAQQRWIRALKLDISKRHRMAMWLYVPVWHRAGGVHSSFNAPHAKSIPGGLTVATFDCLGVSRPRDGAPYQMTEQKHSHSTTRWQVGKSALAAPRRQSVITQYNPTRVNRHAALDDTSNATAPSDMSEEGGALKTTNTGRLIPTVEAETTARVLDTDTVLHDIPSVAYFTSGDYRASKWPFRLLDVLMLLALSISLECFSAPTTMTACIIKAVLTCLSLSALATLIVRFRPYPPSKQWIAYIKLYTLGLSILAAVLNAVMEAKTISGGSAGEALEVMVLSWLVFVMSVGLLLVLLCAFWWNLMDGLKRYDAHVTQARSLNGVDADWLEAGRMSSMYFPQSTLNPIAASGTTPRTSIAQATDVRRSDPRGSVAFQPVGFVPVPLGYSLPGKVTGNTNAGSKDSKTAERDADVSADTSRSRVVARRRSTRTQVLLPSAPVSVRRIGGVRIAAAAVENKPRLQQQQYNHYNTLLRQGPTSNKG